MADLESGGGARREAAPVNSFKIGDKVRFILRPEPGFVTAVDPEANHGLGSIRVRFPDGAELSFPFGSHGLEPAP